MADGHLLFLTLHVHVVINLTHVVSYLCMHNIIVLRLKYYEVSELSVKYYSAFITRVFCHLYRF